MVYVIIGEPQQKLNYDKGITGGSLFIIEIKTDGKHEAICYTI